MYAEGFFTDLAKQVFPYLTAVLLHVVCTLESPGGFLKHVQNCKKSDYKYTSGIAVPSVWVGLSQMSDTAGLPVLLTEGPS